MCCILLGGVTFCHPPCVGRMMLNRCHTLLYLTLVINQTNINHCSFLGTSTKKYHQFSFHKDSTTHSFLHTLNTVNERRATKSVRREANMKTHGALMCVRGNSSRTRNTTLSRMPVKEGIISHGPGVLMACTRNTSQAKLHIHHPEQVKSERLWIGSLGGGG